MTILTKLLLAFAFLLLWGNGINAQTSFDAGLRASVGLSNLQGIGYSQLSGDVGLSFSYPWNDRWGGGIDVFLSRRGGWVEETSETGVYDVFYQRTVSKLDYVCLVPSLHRRVSERWTLNTGPYFGILLAASNHISQEITINGSLDTRNFDQDVTGRYDALDFGWVFAVRYELLPRIWISGEIQQGLKNIYTLFSLDRKYYTNNYSFGIGFLMFKKQRD